METRRSLLLVPLVALCGAAASALIDPTGPPAPPDRSSPEAVARQVAHGEPEQRILPHLDFAEATRLATGTAWQQASPTQQVQLVAAFRSMFVRRYLEAIDAHRGQAMRMLPARRISRDETIVRSQYDPPAEPPLGVEYAMRRTGGEWKIYDITIAGTSLALGCRSMFEQVVVLEGVEGLIRRIRAATRQPPTFVT